MVLSYSKSLSVDPVWGEPLTSCTAGHSGDLQRKLTKRGFHSFTHYIYLFLFLTFFFNRNYGLQSTHLKIGKARRCIILNGALLAR